MSEMSAIPATRRQVRELVDGTLEVKLHIEPSHKSAFLRLLPDVDMPVAIAGLSFVAQAIKPAETEKPPEKLKGGPLAKLAGQWCQSDSFIGWLSESHPAIFDGALRDAKGEVDVAAAMIVRALCGIESRADLDNDAYAAKLFHERVRNPYMAYHMAYLDGVMA